jgi:hypothetical protein
MKKIFFTFVFVMMFAIPTHAWNITLTEEAGKRSVTQTTYNIVNECVTLDLNGKTQIKVCKCGSVAVQEWKEIVPNKDTVTWSSGSSSYIYTVPSADFVYTLPTR